MKLYEIQDAFISLSRVNDIVVEMEERGEDTTELKVQLRHEMDIAEGVLSDKMAAVAGLVRNLEAEAAAYKAEAARMTNSQKSREKQVQFIKDQLIKPTLLTTKHEKINAGTFVVSLRKSKAVQITDESLITAEFMNVKEVVTVDKKGIKTAIESGLKIAGAEIIENKSVQVR